MLRSCANDRTADSSLPGFLPWQILVLFAAVCLFIPDHPLPGLCAAALLLALTYQAIKTPVAWLCLVLVAASALMAAWSLRPEWSSDPPSFLFEARNRVHLQARVHSVRPKPQNRLQIILTDLEITGTGSEHLRKIEGRVVWTWQEANRWPSPGQTVTGHFRLKPIRGRHNFGTWDAAAYWARQKVRYRIFTKAQQTQLTFHEPVKASWRLRLFLRKRILDWTQEGPGQGLLLALLMGDRSQTSYQTLNLVRQASLAHSLALSGLHVGFVVALAWGLAWCWGRLFPSLLTWLPRQHWSVLFAAPLVLAYLWLGQARPSLVRAALMFFFWGVFLLQGRKNILGDGLFFALVVMLCFNPLQVHDLGMQLSFGAVAGIVLLLPAFRQGMKRLSWQGKRTKALEIVLGILGISCIANLVLLPLLVTAFGEWSPHLYLNCLWLPLLGLCVLPLGLIGLTLSLIPGLMPCGGFLLSCSGHILDGMVRILQNLASGGGLGVLVPLRPFWPVAFGYWIFLGSLCLWWRRSRIWPKWLPVFGLVLLLGPGMLQALQNLQDTVTLRLLDVGQGQSIFLQAKHEQTLLVDGGGSWNAEYDLGRHILSPALTWGRSPQVDTVLLTHDDYDHLRGLFYILKHYRIQRFVYNGNWPRGWDGRHLRSILQSRAIPIQSVQAGDSLKLGRHLLLQILHPSGDENIHKDNDASLVLRLCYGRKGLALLPGDIENTGLSALLARRTGLSAEVLVLPHHGSRSSFNPGLYTLVDPDVALVSCGYLNVYHFPHPKVRRYFAKAAIPFLSTARQGQIAVTWNLPGRGRMLRTATGPLPAALSESATRTHWPFSAEYARVP